MSSKQATSSTTQFPCTLCDKVYESKKRLVDHQNDRHRGKTHTCPTCSSPKPI
uniref:C2H2-type domain-containing protein n=1 Tax=Cucumis melo TaxID=3656 RepID=A0A9I9ECJ5_CUCME